MLCQENEKTSQRQGENIAKDTSDEGLVSKIHSKLNSKKMNNLIKKRAENLNRYLTKDTQVAYKQMKRCYPSQTIREMQIKTTVRYHNTPIRKAKL